MKRGQHVQEQEDQEEQDHQARLHPEVAKLQDVMKMKAPTSTWKTMEVARLGVTLEVQELESVARHDHHQSLKVVLHFSAVGLCSTKHQSVNGIANRHKTTTITPLLLSEHL